MKSVDDYSNVIYELAQFMHDNYLEISVDRKIMGDMEWEVQEGTHVLFEELPLANMIIMLELASRVMRYLISGEETRAVCPNCKSVYWGMENVVHTSDEDGNRGIIQAVCNDCGQKFEVNVRSSTSGWSVDAMKQAAGDEDPEH